MSLYSYLTSNTLCLGPTGLFLASPMHSRWKLTSIRRCSGGITEPSVNNLLVFMLKSIGKHRVYNYTFHHRRCKNPQWNPGIRYSCNRLSEPIVTVPALKGEERKTNPAARRQTHTQGRFLVFLTVPHIFLPYAKEGKKTLVSFTGSELPLPVQYYK